MVTILIGIVCLHHMCMAITIPTPVSFNAYECSHFGYFKAAEYAPKPWRVVAVECVPGVEV